MINLLIMLVQAYIAYYMWQVWRQTGQHIYLAFLILNGLFLLSNLSRFF